MIDSDMTNCEVCGMRWTVRPHELCPRCLLADAREDIEDLAAEQRAADAVSGALEARVPELEKEKAALIQAGQNHAEMERVRFDCLAKELNDTKAYLAASETRCKELEEALKEIADWKPKDRVDVLAICEYARAALAGTGTTESDLGGQGSPVKRSGDNPDPTPVCSAVRGGHAQQERKLRPAGNVAEPQLSPESAPRAEPLPSIYSSIPAPAPGKEEDHG